MSFGHFLSSGRRVIRAVTAVILLGPLVSALLLYSGLAPLSAWPWLLFGQAFLIISGAALAGWWINTFVFRPLRQLAEQVTHAANSESHPAIEFPSDARRSSSLAGVSQAVFDISQALARSRIETHKAMTLSAQEATRLSARLEAIIRDLADGIVLCNLSHKIVLFNKSAQSLFEENISLGLGRSLTHLIDERELHEALAELQRRKAGGTDARSIMEFSCKRRSGGLDPLNARMSLVLADNGECEGYVLILKMPSPEPLSTETLRLHEVSDIAPRPEFYDFGLFKDPPGSSLLEQGLESLTITVLDLETTGLKPSQGDEIVQIAGVRIVNGQLVSGEYFDRMVNPGRAIPAAATRIHGITDEMVSQHPPIQVVLADFSAFAQDSVIGGHNAAFDMKCLAVIEQRTGFRFDRPVLDTLLLSMLLQPTQMDHSLDALCRRFEITNAGRHTALGDARATAEVLIKMLPLLKGLGINSLGEAIAACARIYDVRSLQSQF